MEPNTQIEQNSAEVQETQANTVADSQSVQQSTSRERIIAPGMIDKPIVKKKKNNTLLIILVLVLVAGGIYFFIGKGNGNGVGFLAGGNKDGDGKIKIDTGEKWGDAFGSYLQDFYKELEEKRIEEEIKVTDENLEINFIDFDFDNIPEMLVKYSDSTDAPAIRIFKYSNEEISGSKDFRNATFRLVYSLKDKNVDWYIYIINGTNGNKSGAYTKVTKLIKGTAYDSDIKAYTDKEIANFNENYALGDYKYSFYKVENKTFADDFKLAVDKYDGNNKDINNVKEKLLNDYANIEAPEEPINNDPYLIVGEFTLEFGDYVYKRDILQNGEVVETEDVIVTINRDGTITDGNKTIKYNVYSNAFRLENGVNFKVTENNKFVYGAGKGFEYTYVG